MLMDIIGWSVVYVVMGVFATIFSLLTSPTLETWLDNRRSDEASVVALIGIGLFWPGVLLLTVVRLLLRASWWVIVRSPRVPMYLGRGIRDLLPERKAKLPKARVVK